MTKMKSPILLMFFCLIVHLSCKAVEYESYDNLKLEEFVELFSKKIQKKITFNKFQKSKNDISFSIPKNLSREHLTQIFAEMMLRYHYNLVKKNKSELKFELLEFSPFICIRIISSPDKLGETIWGLGFSVWELKHPRAKELKSVLLDLKLVNPTGADCIVIDKKILLFTSCSPIPSFLKKMICVLDTKEKRYIKMFRLKQESANRVWEKMKEENRFIQRISVPRNESVFLIVSNLSDQKMVEEMIAFNGDSKQKNH